MRVVVEASECPVCGHENGAAPHADPRLLRRRRCRAKQDRPKPVETQNERWGLDDALLVISKVRGRRCEEPPR